MDIHRKVQLQNRNITCFISSIFIWKKLQMIYLFLVKTLIQDCIPRERCWVCSTFPPYNLYLYVEEHNLLLGSILLKILVLFLLWWVSIQNLHSSIKILAQVFVDYFVQLSNFFPTKRRQIKIRSRIIISNFQGEDFNMFHGIII